EVIAGAQAAGTEDGAPRERTPFPPHDDQRQDHHDRDDGGGDGPRRTEVERRVHETVCVGMLSYRRAVLKGPLDIMPHRAPGAPGKTRQQYLSGRPIRYYRPRGSADIRQLIDD